MNANKLNNIVLPIVLFLLTIILTYIVSVEKIKNKNIILTGLIFVIDLIMGMIYINKKRNYKKIKFDIKKILLFGLFSFFVIKKIDLFLVCDFDRYIIYHVLFILFIFLLAAHILFDENTDKPFV